MNDIIPIKKPAKNGRFMRKFSFIVVQVEEK